MRRILTALVLMFSAIAAVAQTNTVWAPQAFTGVGTGAIMQFNGLPVANSYSVGTITLTGVSLTTVTFAVQASNDNGVSFYAVPVYTVANPSAGSATSITATAAGQYQVSLVGVTHIKITVSGTFTATSVSFTLSASPSGNLLGKSGGTGGSISLTTTGSSGAATLSGTTLNVPNYGLALANCANAGLQSGSDIGAQVNAAYAGLPIYTDKNSQQWPYGCIVIPSSATAYVDTTTIAISSPFVNLYGEGQVNVWYGGSGDFIRIQQTQLSGGIHNQLPMSGTQIYNINILNTTSAGVSGIHAGDMQWIGIHNVTISGFNAGSTCSGPTGGVTAAGIWLDNVLFFTEDLRLDQVQTYDNCIGERFTLEPQATFTATSSNSTTLTIASVSSSSIPFDSVVGLTAQAGSCGTHSVFVASGSGTNLTVSSVTSGTITVGDVIVGSGVPAGTTIVSQTSGPTGGTGVYVTSAATTSSSATITSYGNPCIPASTHIIAQVSGTPGGAGVYTTDNPTVLNSATATTTVGTNSFAYGQQDSVLLGMRSGEVGVSVENGTFLYHQSWRFATESNNASTWGMVITGNGAFGGVPAQNGGDNWVDWRDECVGCGTPMVMLDLASSTAVFRAGGLMTALSSTATISTTSGSIMEWSGTNGPASDTLYFLGFQTDGGLRFYHNNVITADIYSNNWRLQGGATIANFGWSTAPSTAALFLAIGPKSNGSSTLCVNIGTTGTCAGTVESSGLTLDNLIGNDGLVCSVAGVFGTVGCPTASLPSGSSGQLLVGQGGTSYTPQTVGGDATLSSAGALTVTKTNGTAFGTAAVKNTGTSGSNVALLNGANTWSAQQNFSVALAPNNAPQAGSCSSSGALSYSEPFVGAGLKMLVVWLNACNGTFTITYPTAFTNAPSAITSANSSDFGTPSTTAVTVTGTGATSYITLIGW